MTQGGFGRLFYWGSCESPLFAVPAAAGGVCELPGWAQAVQRADKHRAALLREMGDIQPGRLSGGLSGCVRRVSY